MPSELTRQRILAKIGTFNSIDGRWEFPTSSFRQIIDAAVNTQITDRTYAIQPTQLLTARDDGSVAAIDVASFVIHWPDIPAVAYQGATVGSLAFSTTYIIYFHDADRDGTPDSCFFATTDALQIAGDSGIIILGTIATPADGGGNVTVVSSPGGGGLVGGDSSGKLKSDLLDIP